MHDRGIGKKRIAAFLLSAALLLSAAAAGLLTGGLLTETPAEAASAKVVVLDPGHGGSEKGACYYGMEEKTLNLKIAKYCKAELGKYENVRVILTRTTDRKFNTSDLMADLKARCLVAKNNNAAIFVCLHNNAYGEGESTKTNGARVYYQNHSYYRSVGDASHELAKTLVNRIAACGLTNGGARTKYSDDRSRRDKNGKRGDGYGVLYYSKLFKIPGVIVEHAFMSNPGDAAKLQQEAFLKKLGQADAEGIARYLGLKKKKTGWQTSGGSKYYYDANGKKVIGWRTVNGKKYYFRKPNGVMLKGWGTIGGKKYYCSKKDGHMLKGWQTIGGKKYYFSKKDGHTLTGTQKIGSKTYQFNEKGVLIQTGS